MKKIFFIAMSLVLSACTNNTGVKINHLAPVLYVGKANRIEAEITMSEPIDKMMIMLKSNKYGFELGKSDIEYKPNKKSGTFSVKDFVVPKGTALGKDTIIIGAYDIKGNFISDRWQIWIAHPDSRFEKSPKIDE